MLDYSLSYFHLFSLPQKFGIDIALLTSTYRTLQSQYHPDRVATASETEKRINLQAATFINEAFRTLSSPMLRGRYLLTLAGIDTEEESNTFMPNEFLMQQMAWREEIEVATESQNKHTLKALVQDIQSEAKHLELMLAESLDNDPPNYPAAWLAVRKLSFLAKLDTEINEAIV